MQRDRIETLKANAKLDVRLPDQLKDEFLARCREEGVSSGAVIRSLIIDYVRTRPRPLLAKVAQLRETALKRSRVLLGGSAAALAAALAGASVLFAPFASAEDVDLVFDLRVETGDGSTYEWNWDYPATFNNAETILPEEFAGSRYGLRVEVLPCEPSSRHLADTCQVILQLSVLELDRRRGADGGVTILDEVVVAEPRLAGRLGAPMSVHMTSNNGEFSYALTAQINGLSED